MIRKLMLIACIAASALPCSVAKSQETSASAPLNFDQVMQAAVKAREENRDDEAIQLFRRAVDMRAESEEGLWYLGTMLYEKEQFTETRDVLRRFMTLRPDAGPGWALLGLSEFQLREYPRALEHLQRAISQGMGDRQELQKEAYYDVVVLLTRAERFEGSMDLIQKMLASGEPDSRLLEPAGLAGMRLPYLPSEIPSDQREMITLAGTAVFALLTQHYEQADSEFKRLVAAYPDEPGVHFLRGAYLAQLHPSEARPEFEREIEISPSHAVARVRLAEQLISAGEFDRALTLARQAIELDPKRASGHMMAGEALIAKGEATGGIEELETARQDDPAIGRVHWDLLRAYAAAGRREDADREKKKIEKLYHGNSSNHQPTLGDSSHEVQAPQ